MVSTRRGKKEVGDKRKNGGAFELKNENNRGELRTFKDERGISSEHDKHLWAEKRRRKKMKNMFQELHFLLPNQPPHKASLAIIVDETISYIKSLQQTLKKLEMQKIQNTSQSTNTSSQMHRQKEVAESLLSNGSSSDSHTADMVSRSKLGPFSMPSRRQPVFQTWTSSNVCLNVCGLDAHINICSSNKHGLLSEISQVLERHKMDVLYAQVYSHLSKSMFMIHARVNADSDDCPTDFAYEEIFKKAALEMMLLANSKSS